MPTTRSSAPTQTSFMNVRSVAAVSAENIGRKRTR